MQKKTKKITLESLASTMEAGFKQVNHKIDAGFKQAEENRESLARMISNGFDQTATDFSRLEQGQENIILSLDNMAPKFEVKQLERRVKRLEDKAGIRHTLQH